MGLKPLKYKFPFTISTLIAGDMLFYMFSIETKTYYEWSVTSTFIYYWVNSLKPITIDTAYGLEEAKKIIFCDYKERVK